MPQISYMVIRREVKRDDRGSNDRTGNGIYWQKKKKYKSTISQGGSNVSGGQKQRLSIARAIAKHPDVYIFDDSFSALDYKTDATLRAKLKEKTSESTVMIVAQRISTILHADRSLC